MERVAQLHQSAMIARAVGIVAIALGFMLGIYGLEHPDTGLLGTARGLIVTGLLAQGYALYCVIRRAKAQTDGQQKPTDKPDHPEDTPQ